MDDLEFARRVSARIGELYSEAKRSQHHFPRHALIQTRALASLCCDMLYPAGSREAPGLDEKIRALVKARLINPDTRALLHDLRRWGNAAAHPEDSLLDEARFASLARQALAASVSLLETVFRQQHGGAAVPAYEVVDGGRKDELKEVCYRAVLENSAADQYQVAMLLRHQWVAKVEETGAGPDAALASYARRFEFGALEGRALDLLGYASDANYAPACYQYGLALSEGRRGEQFMPLGVSLIARASENGNIDALAWRGRSALYGLHGEPVDFARAREYLERAAAEDHPLALTLLSNMYREGLGMAADAKAAFGLTLRAAEAGYPIGQYQAGVALYRGDGVARDEPAALAWLERASEAGLPEARHVVGNLVRRGVLPGGFAGAERLLGSALLRVNEAYLDLAELYMAQPEPARWIEASRLVQAAYEKALRAKDEPLAGRALRAAPPLVARIEASHAIMSDDERRDFVAARFMFDAHGQPFPDREERLRVFVASTMALAQVQDGGPGEEGGARRDGVSGPANIAAPAPASTPVLRSPAALAPVVQRVTQAKVGRNDPCPCGSGQKYKACCG